MTSPALPKLTRLGIVATCVASLLSACRDNGDVSSGPSQLITVAGSGQQGAVGAPLSTSPTVRVQDAAGAAVSGVTVHFAVLSGGGRLVGDSARSDANGRAAVGQWVLGTSPGPNSLQATVGGTSITTTVAATAIPGLAVGIRAAGQTGFLGLVGHLVTPLPAVRVIDSYGNPVPGTIVTFSVIVGSGAVTGATAVANASGIAQPTSWTLGAELGPNQVLATIPSGPSFTFTAQGVTTAPFIGPASPISQSGYLQFPVTSVPRVRVLDALGRPIVGVPVTFAVTTGDGALIGPVGLTDTGGVASPTDWRLGLTAGTVTATVPTNSQSLVFSASGVDASFLIDLRFLTSIDNDQRDAFVAAARRWMAIITGHLAPIPITLPAGSCDDLQPAMSETVRDVVIFAEVVPIDGPLNILGSASPCASRSTTGLTIVGTMEFDSADLPALVTANQLVDVITHEMAHVLGFGTVWSSRNLVTGLGGSDPRFVGTEAVSIWPSFATALGFAGTTPPVENVGGAGTAGSHWRESVFQAELMTGIIELPGVQMPLSRLTIASMKDLGYEVDFSKAETFVGHLLAAGTPSTSTTRINERNSAPKFEVTPLGVMRIAH